MNSFKPRHTGAEGASSTQWVTAASEKRERRRQEPRAAAAQRSLLEPRKKAPALAGKGPAPAEKASASEKEGFGGIFRQHAADAAIDGTSGNPPPAPNFKYAMQALDIQEDGASCGFGMITLAFLAVFGIEINEDCIGVLSSLDVTHIKHHWKCILTSWHIEENGLDVKPVYNFLEYFGVEYPDGCIALRPAWVSRFDPSQLSNVRPCNTTPSAQAPESRIPRQPNGQFLAHMKACFEQINQNGLVHSFGRENVSPTDLQRFLGHGGGMMANDELIDIFVAIGNHQWMSSFFYPKLRDFQELVVKANKRTRPQSETLEKVMKWFKKAWEAYADKKAEKRNPYRVVLEARRSETMSAPYSLAAGQVLIIFLQVLSLETQNELPDYDPSWEIKLINEVDCGFFAIMVAAHLIYFHRLNPENVPDPLKLESTNMLTTRLVLASTLIHWCTNPILGADGPVQNSREFLDDPYADLESQERVFLCTKKKVEIMSILEELYIRLHERGVTPQRPLPPLLSRLSWIPALHDKGAMILRRGEYAGPWNSKKARAILAITGKSRSLACKGGSAGITMLSAKTHLPPGQRIIGIPAPVISGFHAGKVTFYLQRCQELAMGICDTGGRGERSSGLQRQVLIQTMLGAATADIRSRLTEVKKADALDGKIIYI
ncbi:hypothetical protein C8J57DRAFT_1243522 [Mycena rebaudengoi]|nr:hypothetical protein C8J57DRAFT_1243522 [Mycena rebaudengoi]